jgi:tRNA modification GTPase
VAFFGEANAGKSSLINAMLAQERLIVTDTPGTTRDYVEVAFNLENGRIYLIDTAGLGSSADPLKQNAARKTRELLEEVDYKILVIDGTKKETRLKENISWDMRINTKSDAKGDPGSARSFKQRTVFKSARFIGSCFSY